MELNSVTSKVAEVNKRIEAYNKKAEEQRARRKVLTEQLQEKCKEYENKYGVSLYSESLEEMKERVEAMLKEEIAAVSEAMEKAEKLLSMAEEGDYEGMNVALGIKEEVVEIPVDGVNNSKGAEESSADLGTDFEEVELEPKKKSKKAKPVSEDVLNELDDLDLGSIFEL